MLDMLDMRSYLIGWRTADYCDVCRNHCCQPAGSMLYDGICVSDVVFIIAVWDSLGIYGSAVCFRISSFVVLDTCLLLS